MKRQLFLVIFLNHHVKKEHVLEKNNISKNNAFLVAYF